jgi:hypothetical protein
VSCVLGGGTGSYVRDQYMWKQRQSVCQTGDV